MSQTLSLYRLQQIDSQIDHIQARLQAIQLLIEDNTELSSVEKINQDAEERFLSAEIAMKQAEIALQDQQIKIQHTEASLYGKASHTPKELQDLQNDVAAMKRYKVTLEDRLLETMQLTESAEVERHSSKANLEMIQDRQKAQIEKLREENILLQNDAERLIIERDAIAEAIPNTERALYDQLRKQRRGIAVATISEKSCSACGSSLSAGQIQSAHSSSNILLCPSCGRILYGS